MNRFDALSEQLKAMQQAGLEDSPVYQRIATMALEAAPDSLKSHIMDLAIQEGRLPKPEGYDDAGEPVWKLEAIAEFFGLDVEEAKASIREFQEAHGRAGTVDSASISRIH